MKKKILSCLVAGILAIGMASTTAVSAATETDEATGLSVTLETDKTSYQNGDTLSFEWFLENESTYNVSIPAA